jgi:hypothetical protein
MSWFGDTFLGGAQAKAANVQAQAGKDAMGLINQYYDQAQKTQQPQYDTGSRALGTLEKNVNNGVYDMPTSGYQAQPFNYQQSPGYQFQLQQGLQGVQNSAAAQGQGLSGATMKALQRYGTGLAAQDYNNQFQNYANERNYGLQQNQQNYSNNYNNLNNQYNRLSDIANYGQQAGNNLSNMSMYRGNSLSDITGQIGNAQAAGMTGQANAVNRTLGNLLSFVPMAAGLFAGNPAAATKPGNLYDQTKQPYYNVY